MKTGILTLLSIVSYFSCVKVHIHNNRIVYHIIVLQKRRASIARRYKWSELRWF